MSTNKHGLSRNIPERVKYLVRKQAHFGCVAPNCGIAFGTYEHIDPPFSDATEHDPQKMTFLCSNHHAKVTSTFFSKQTVKRWQENPWCKQTGSCHDSFDVGPEKFAIWIGNNKIEGIEKILTLDEECLLTIKPPEEKGAPFRVSATFHDSENNKILQIIENEWIANSDSFDIVCGAGKIVIKKNKWEIALKIACHPPYAIVIEELSMIYKGLSFKTDGNGVQVTGPVGGNINIGGGRLFTSMDKEASFMTFSSKEPGVKIAQSGSISISTLNEPMPHRTIRKTCDERNAECPCGSKKKYKKCCWLIEEILR